jgi:hypothetical protein
MAQLGFGPDFIRPLGPCAEITQKALDERGINGHRNRPRRYVAAAGGLCDGLPFVDVAKPQHDARADHIRQDQR